MVFHSLEYVLLFLPFVVVAQWLLLRWSGPAGAKVLLLAASFIAYAGSSLQTLPVLLGSLLLNYLVARQIRRSGATPWRRRWLVFGICGDVGILVAFKYTHFLLQNLAPILPWTITLPAFALPLGLSFFSIQQIMYLVDCYEELITPASLLEHALFIGFFPTISAGPLLRAGALLPQLDDRERVRFDRIAAGLLLLIIGLLKKLTLAAFFARFADAGFGFTAQSGLLESWMTAVAFQLQLYFDFSGYSDMAVGTGLMLGLSLPPNFDSPFKATSIIDFWKRWHMTLTSFITTYLYTPMARAMRPLTFSKAMVITVISMAIAGLWHGAAWTYVLFGVMHGVGLVTNHVWRKRKLWKVPRPLAIVGTFVYVLAAHVFFRAASVREGLSVVAGLLGAHGFGYHGAFGSGGAARAWTGIGFLVMLAALGTIPLRNSNQICADFRPSRRWVFASAAALVLCLVCMNASATKGFIYRDF